jgi:hypothetical protein
MGKRFVRIATANGEYMARLSCEMVTLPVANPAEEPWLVELSSPYVLLMVRGPNEHPTLRHVEFPILEELDRRAPLNELAEAAMAATILHEAGASARVAIVRTEDGEGTPLRGGSFRVPVEHLPTLGATTTLRRCAMELGRGGDVPISLREVGAIRAEVLGLWGGLCGSLTPRVGHFSLKLQAPPALLSGLVAVVVRGVVVLGDTVMAAAGVYMGRPVVVRKDGRAESSLVDPEYCALFKGCVPEARFSFEEFDARITLAARGFARDFMVFDLAGAKLTRRFDQS